MVLNLNIGDYIFQLHIDTVTLNKLSGTFCGGEQKQKKTKHTAVNIGQGGQPADRAIKCAFLPHSNFFLFLPSLTQPPENFFSTPHYTTSCSCIVVDVILDSLKLFTATDQVC